MTSDAIKEFVAEARLVTIAEAAVRLDLKFIKGRSEHAQPCPVCGGTDRFAFNPKKSVWHCRGAGVGGHDAIGMAAHALELDLKRRDGFLAACSAVTGRDVPEGGERESDADRATRLARLDSLKLKHYEDMARDQASADDWRERERDKARGIVNAALFLDGRDEASRYLNHRGCQVPGDRWLRVSPSQTYWHGQDDRGSPVSLYEGAAMVAPFIDLAGTIIGCHLTWIALGRPPKYRPDLFALTREGAKAGLAEWRFGDPHPDVAGGLYEPLPTKKMRGSKKGGLIPLCGRLDAERWVGGEGIENGLAFAGWEDFRPDTFYFAAGDIGNLSGPADPASRFAHPTLTKPDRNGHERPVMVAGPVPKRDRAPDDIMPVAAHVRELVLLGDGDSEPVWTAAAVARARAAHHAPGRTILTVWPPRGRDLSDLAREATD